MTNRIRNISIIIFVGMALVMLTAYMPHALHADMEADDGKKIKECFESHMATIINELFDPKEPFVQTANEKNCKYCKFKDFCRKE